MSPETHLLASWLIAAKTTSNPRDCRLVTLAGILPDADGLGLLVDMFNSSFRHKETFYYAQYHHWYLHGALGAVLITGLLTCFARQRLRVALLALIVFHLHLLCDLAGSRGPSPGDLWPIYYFGPFTLHHGMWLWHGQWRLDGWQNRAITLPLFFWALWLASKRNDSVVGVFNRRLDRIFVRVLHEWRQAGLKWFQARGQKTP
jgi:inner membrane protein